MASNMKMVGAIVKQEFDAKSRSAGVLWQRRVDWLAGRKCLDRRHVQLTSVVQATLNYNASSPERFAHIVQQEFDERAAQVWLPIVALPKGKRELVEIKLSNSSL